MIPTVLVGLRAMDGFERNPDTELLASQLHLAWTDALDEGLPLNEVWYRVAARAKELRA